MKATAEKAEMRLVDGGGKQTPARSSSYRELEAEVESDLLARLAQKAEQAFQAKVQQSGSALTSTDATVDDGSPPRTDSFETAGDDVFARMKKAAEAQEAKLLGKSPTSVSPTPRSSRSPPALKSALKPSSMSPVVAKPVAKPAGPAPRKAKKASALKGKKGKRSGTMPGQAVAGSTAGAEEEEQEDSSDGEPWTGYDDVETPPTSDDEDEIGGDTSSLFDDMFGGMLPSKPGQKPEPEPLSDEKNEESDDDDDGDDDDDNEDSDGDDAPGTSTQAPHEPDMTDNSQIAAEYAELNAKFQHMMMEVEMLKLKLDREQNLKKDYQDNCLRLENELEVMGDEIEKLTEQKSELTDQLRTARQEDFSVPVEASAVESLGGDNEVSKAMATAAAGLRTEDIWEGSAKFISLTQRFGKFMDDQAEASRVDSCVVEFVFSPDLSEQLGGISEKSFKVSVHNQICQILSLVCSRLHVPNSQMYEISTLRGFELNKDRSLASYGLGVLFKRWIVKLSIPALPVGSDPAEDTAMVQSLLDDHFNTVWETIAQQEATRLDEREAAARAQWESIDARYALTQRWLGVSQSGRRKALAFLMQVEREEEASKVTAGARSHPGKAILEKEPEPVYTRRYRLQLLSSMLSGVPMLGNADVTKLARDLQIHMRLVERPDNSRVIHGGFVANEMVFVLNGELRQASRDETAQHTLQPGSWYGEQALFIGNYLPVTSYDAQGDVTMYRLSRPDFMAVLMRYPELEKIVERLTVEMFASESLTSKTTERRLTAAERAELNITTEFIHQVPMFHGLTDPLCVDALAARLTPVTIAANAVVCEKGQVGQEMYFVREGFVEMLPELDQPAFGQKGPGSFFGEMALLNSEPRNAYCRCLTETSGYVLTKSDLQHVLIEFPAMEAMVRRPLIDRETERARVLGEMMAATATTLSRKEQRRQAANTLQRAGKRFVDRKLEQRAQRETELEALRLSECVFEF
jgi:CRP-like cAMP-binding protein